MRFVVGSIVVESKLAENNGTKDDVSKLLWIYSEHSGRPCPCKGC